LVRLACGYILSRDLLNRQAALGSGNDDGNAAIVGGV